ncbi:MAG: histidine phosphatase family protein [Candidatus Saccharimonadales bacterium]
MKQLYFVRHGESEANLQRVFAGQMDTPLTNKGRTEARTASESLKNQHFDLIVSSPLVRAHETAQIIAHKIGYSMGSIIVSDIFKEHYIGDLAGKSWDEYDEFDSRISNMESYDDLQERAKKGLKFLESRPEDTILLVGHGSFVRHLRTAIDPTQEYTEPKNAEVIKLI